MAANKLTPRQRSDRAWLAAGERKRRERLARELVDGTSPPAPESPKDLALQVALDALQELSEHPAFADDAPEFNKNGVGYTAITLLKIALGEDL